FRVCTEEALLGWRSWPVLRLVVAHLTADDLAIEFCCAHLRAELEVLEPKCLNRSEQRSGDHNCSRKHTGGFTDRTHRSSLAGREKPPAAKFLRWTTAQESMIRSTGTPGT